MSKKYYLLIAFLLLVLIGIGIYFKCYEQYVSVKSPELYQKFADNETQANQQYLDKKLKVKGVLIAVSKGGNGSLNLTLEGNNPMGGVTCEVPAENIPEGTNLHTGQQVTVKGQCAGFLLDVVLVNCKIDD